MPTPTYTVECLRNAEIARETWEFLLRKPDGFSFAPGQFVLFKVPLVENPTDVQPRAFSIASAPGEEGLLFVVKLKAGGRASRWVEETLRAGTPVELQGPFGNFLLKDSGRRRLYIATSTGIAPFRSMLAGDPRRGGEGDEVVFGVRSEEDVFWLEELRSLAPKAKVHLTLSRPGPSWTGLRGRVQSVVPELVPDVAERDVYVCGNPDMTKEVKGLCMEKWGVKKENLHVEGYI